MIEITTTVRGQAAPTIVAVIPCLNEARYIGNVVTSTRKYIDKIIVINDGSTDDTANNAQKAGAIVIEHKKPLGQGAAIKTGFRAALEMHADIVLTLDGDGQHNPDEIPLILEPITRGNTDLVIGSRFLKPVKNIKSSFWGIGTKFLRPTEGIKGYRRLGIGVITYLYNLGAKTGISDSQCSFRAYNRKLLENICITEKGFSFSIQILIQARRKGFHIMEVPVTCIYHDYSSSLNPIIHGIIVAFSVIRLRLFK
jgi:glycosyltransferase involved in cell wall biosynthesis